MRHNNRKTLPEFPVPTRLDTPAVLLAFEHIAFNADKASISDDIYKGKYRDTALRKDRYEVRERLVEIYHEKCAYCEDIDAKPEVEHYRPKKEVSGEPAHPGYYWLCYEWSNLLPSCRYCNTEGGKGNKFPILGHRVGAPFINAGAWDKTTITASAAALLIERPFLLHPEVDHPDDGSYFRFKKNGEIEGIDPEGRGEQTIGICNMNRQNLLLRRRKLVIMPIVKSIRRMLKLQLRGRFVSDEAFTEALELVFEEILEMQQPTEPFSLLAIDVYHHFDDLVVPLMETTPAQESAVAAAFANFKANNPL
jgi:uncharacterized protein (TIGR02646 family)